MYRKVDTKLWDDSKVEELSGNATYLLLYLLTAPAGSIVGCYEITYKRIARDMKLRVDAVRTAMKELCDSNIVEYSATTNEVLVMNWFRYNLTKSEKLEKPVIQGIEEVKDPSFKAYLEGMFESWFEKQYRYPIDTVSIPYGEGMDRHSVSVSVSDTVTAIEEGDIQPEAKSRVETRHGHGEFKNVLLTDTELDQLKAKFPNDWQKRIDDLSYYIGSSGKKYKSHYRTILSWHRKEQPKGVSVKNAIYD